MILLNRWPKCNGWSWEKAKNSRFCGYDTRKQPKNIFWSNCFFKLEAQSKSPCLQLLRPAGGSCNRAEERPRWFPFHVFDRHAQLQLKKAWKLTKIDFLQVRSMRVSPMPSDAVRWGYDGTPNHILISSHAFPVMSTQLQVEKAWKIIKIYFLQVRSMRANPVPTDAARSGNYNTPNHFLISSHPFPPAALEKTWKKIDIDAQTI